MEKGAQTDSDRDKNTLTGSEKDKGQKKTDWQSER